MEFLKKRYLRQRLNHGKEAKWASGFYENWSLFKDEVPFLITNFDRTFPSIEKYRDIITTIGLVAYFICVFCVESCIALRMGTDREKIKNSKRTEKPYG